MIQEGFSEEERSGQRLAGRTRVLIRTEEAPKPLLLSIRSLCCGMCDQMTPRGLHDSVLK